MPRLELCERGGGPGLSAESGLSHSFPAVLSSASADIRFLPSCMCVCVCMHHETAETEEELNYVNII